MRAYLVVLSVIGALVGILAIAFVGCTPTVTSFTDFGIAAAACLAPRACYRPDCACNRASLNECVICEPTTQPSQSCDCSAQTSSCLDEAQVCVGRSPTACNGVGARCVPAGSSCGETQPLEAPPQLVAVVGSNGDGGEPTLELRCAFADDICCPPLGAVD